MAPPAAATAAAPARLPLPPLPVLPAPSVAAVPPARSRVTVPDVAAYLLVHGYAIVAADWPREGACRFDFEGPEDEIRTAVEGYAWLPEARFARAVLHLKRGARSVPPSWDPFRVSNGSAGAPRGPRPTADRARAFATVDPGRHIVRVFDLDFAAYLFLHGGYLADAATPAPATCVFDFYDPSAQTRAHALAFLASPEARFAAAIRSLKKIVYSSTAR